MQKKMVCSNSAHLYLPYYQCRTRDVYMCVRVCVWMCLLVNMWANMFMWVCALVCVRECTYMYMCKYTCVQRPGNNPVCFSNTSMSFTERESFTDLRLANWARLTSQGARYFLSPPPWHMSSPWALNRCTRELNWGLHAYSNNLISWASFQSFTCSLDVLLHTQYGFVITLHDHKIVIAILITLIIKIIKL